MTIAIAPRPTAFDGTRYRSKLEAEHAELFSEPMLSKILGPFAYESKRLQTNGVGYWPDFWFPESELVIEVKGVMRPGDSQKIDSWLALNDAPVRHFMVSYATGQFPDVHSGGYVGEAGWPAGWWPRHRVIEQANIFWQALVSSTKTSATQEAPEGLYMLLLMAGLTTKSEVDT